MTKKTYTTKLGTKQFMPVLSESELMTERSTGFCLACGQECDGVEPDAEKYDCLNCGKPKVYGLEELAMRGLCEITAEV